MNIKTKKEKQIIKPAIKKLDAKKFLGLIKWDEDPVQYQRRLRDGK